MSGFLCSKLFEVLFPQVLGKTCNNTLVKIIFRCDKLWHWSRNLKGEGEEERVLFSLVLETSLNHARAGALENDFNISP